MTLKTRVFAAAAALSLISGAAIAGKEVVSNVPGGSASLKVTVPNVAGGAATLAATPPSTGGGDTGGGTDSSGGGASVSLTTFVAPNGQVTRGFAGAYLRIITTSVDNSGGGGGIGGLLNGEDN